MRGRLVWSMFSLCALLVLVALVWISLVVLRLERSGEQARIESMHQDNIRVALWRLDSWFSPYLVRENARPYFEYSPYYSLDLAYGEHLFLPADAGEVLTPSPLLKSRSDILALYFQVDSNGLMTSPQVPSAGLRELAAETVTTEDVIAEKERLLEELRMQVDPDVLAAALSDSEKRNEIDERWIAKIDAIQEEQLTQSDWVDQGLAKQREYTQRAVASNNALQSAQSRQSLRGAPQIAQKFSASEPLVQVEAGDLVCQVITEPLTTVDAPQVGPLLPVWLDGTDPIPLLLRHVRVGDQSLIQGVLLNWDVLAEQLMAEAAELVPNAQLQPVLGADRDFNEADFLASLPVALIAPAPAPTIRGTLTTERVVLILVWIAAFVALGAAGSTLATTMAFARKRSRFASSVTHELRTPLTTFQMYSEMLADGMVQDETKRKQYLDTLKGESKRLSTLVENVLTWSRVEAGRLERRPIEMTIDALTTALDSLLRHRCSDSGVSFSLENTPDGSQEILVDRDIIERILFNLVDNACKYGAIGEDAAVRLDIECSGDQLRCTVSDNGPGISQSRHRAIFRPFEQGHTDAENSDARSGVGLGLALCRELARVLGGDLKLIDHSGAGAIFRLEVPC